MSRVAIRVEKLGKRYRIGEREYYRTLRDALTSTLRAPWRRFRPCAPESSNHQPQHIWALKDISFEVREGEVVGLIGRNGAGKTTLLKILARVTRPTEGYADVRGRMGSLLEVGTGFHHELTGRENTFLSGAILGMSKSEIRRKFDEIVAFAGVEKFIDTPLKRYSSGMQMRLAFAIAAHLDPEILLVDEVLAVGDLEFQKKCLGKMSEVARGGRTIVFVSHQMNQIRRLCERVAWLEAGYIHKLGPTGEIVSAYEAALTASDLNREKRPDVPVEKGRFFRWGLVQPPEDQPHVLTSLGPVTVKFDLEVNEPLIRVHHGVALFSHENQLMWAWATNIPRLDPGQQSFCHSFPMLPLRPGLYSWHVSLYADDELLDAWSCTPDFIIATEVHQHSSDEWNGVLNVPCEFKIQTAEQTRSTKVADAQP